METDDLICTDPLRIGVDRIPFSDGD
jgi:hypothetical protein